MDQSRISSIGILGLVSLDTFYSVLRFCEIQGLDKQCAVLLENFSNIS
jgi:hypothetical protein